MIASGYKIVRDLLLAATAVTDILSTYRGHPAIITTAIPVTADYGFPRGIVAPFIKVEPETWVPEDTNATNGALMTFKVGCYVVRSEERSALDTLSDAVRMALHAVGSTTINVADHLVYSQIVDVNEIGEVGMFVCREIIAELFIQRI